MSKFRIYTTKGISFNRIEKLNKAFYISSAIIPLVGVLVFIGEKLNMPDYVPIIIIAIWGIVIIALILFTRFVNKSLNPIGYLILSANKIQKSIGDLVISKTYDEIRGFKINKHLSSLFFSSNLDGSKTYLFSIINDDFSIDQLVISSHSVDPPFVNFKELVEKIRKRKKIS